MPDTTYSYGVKPGEGSNRESLRGGRVATRRKPSETATARAGNYVAPVDTVGMDPEMQATLETKPKPKKKPVGIVDRIKAGLGIK